MTGGRRQQARQGKATGMETAPPVNERRATGLSLNDGTGEGKARRRTGLEIQSTGCFGHRPNTAVLSWSAQPTESRDLVRDHRQSIPIPNANQSDPVTLQVRTLTSHAVDYPQNEYDEPLHDGYVLWQSESVDGSTTSCALSVGADSVLDRGGVLRSRDVQESKTDWQLLQSVGNQNAPSSTRISAVGSGSVVGFDSFSGGARL